MPKRSKMLAATSRLEEIKERITASHYEVETDAEIAASQSQVYQEAERDYARRSHDNEIERRRLLDKTQRITPGSGSSYNDAPVPQSNCNVFGMAGLAEREAHETRSSLGGWWRHCVTVKDPRRRDLPCFGLQLFHSVMNALLSSREL